MTRRRRQAQCDNSLTCDSSNEAPEVQIGPQADSAWLHVYTPGFRGLLLWVWRRYGAPVLVTENGMDRKGESSMSITHALQDQDGVDTFSGYLCSLQEAGEVDGMDGGATTRGLCWTGWSVGRVKQTRASACIPSLTVTD